MPAIGALPENVDTAAKKELFRWLMVASFISLQFPNLSKLPVTIPSSPTAFLHQMFYVRLLCSERLVVTIKGQAIPSPWRQR